MRRFVLGGKSVAVAQIRFGLAVVAAALALVATAVGASADGMGAGGASTSSFDTNNGGIRAQISGVTSPQANSDGAIQYFYVTEGLSDGSIYEAGTTMNYNGCGTTCYRFFVAARDNLGYLRTSGSWTATDTSHMIGFMRTPSTNYNYDWWAAFDGVRYGNTDYITAAGDSGPNTPQDWAWVSVAGYGVLPVQSDGMGYVNFYNPAMQMIYPGSNTWFDSPHAEVRYYNYFGQTYPQINVVPSGYEVFSAGAPLGPPKYPPYPYATVLW